MQQVSQTNGPLTRKGRKPIAHPADIKAGIEKAESSQAEIARKFGVTRTTVNKVVYGQGSSRKIAQHIADLLELTLDELWPGRYSDDVTNNPDHGGAQRLRRTKK